jgi:threonylcarbamoyladenosine tRNA methylthiotransferase MtaB
MKYSILTLGCKVNQYETQALETFFQQRGYEPAQGEQADVVVVNTCAVTAESGRKSRQAIRRAKVDNPDALLAVCGCFSQLSSEAVQELGADIVFGSGDKHGFIEAIDIRLQEKEQGKDPIICVDNPFQRRIFEDLPAGAVSGRTRAMLKIQDGCANFCTYCVIPYTRGRIRSLPLQGAAEHTAKLRKEGYKELVITGIEIASYGRDFRDGTTLADVVEVISGEAGDMRLRLGSLEPTVITEEFCRRISTLGTLCRHFHLSLQSGCDTVLKRMNRKYDTEQFYASVERLRKFFPGCGLTADLIVGFPGETEGEYDQTLAFIKKCGFSSMHIFPYSIRPGTKAAEMPGQLTRQEKAIRAHEAQQVAEQMELAYLNSQIGTSLPVLFETERDGIWFGHGDNYCPVQMCGEKLHGVVENVQIIQVLDRILVGKKI